MSQAKEKAYTYELTQQLLIQALFHEPDFIPTVSSIVSSEDFSNIRYQHIYKCLLDLYADKIEKVNYKSELNNYLKENYQEELLIEDYQLLDEPNYESPLSLSKLLRTRAVTYQAKIIAQTIQDGLEDSSSSLEMLGRAQSSFNDLALRLTDEQVDFSDVVSEWAEDTLSEETEDDYYTIPTPYPTFNKYLSGGFKPNQLVTVAARTGIGKTVVATNLAAAACTMGKSVVYFSLEMTQLELIKRLTATQGNIFLGHLSKGPGRNENVIEKIRATTEEIKRWKMTIVDEADVTVEKIRSISQKISKSPTGLDMVIIDYLQLISTKGLSGRTRQEQVAEISRTCKMIAKELGVPVIVLVQLKRGDKNDDEDRLPTKDEIRESGAIAQDSDVVLIVHRKESDDSTTPKAMFIIDKNRGGPAVRKFFCHSVLEKNLFVDTQDESGNLENITENIQQEQSQLEETPVDFGSPADIRTDTAFDNDKIEDEFADIFEEL